MPPESRTKEHKTIVGRTLEIENTARPLDEFRLDPTNPRIAHEISIREESEETLTESEIEDLLWKSEEVKRLHRAIIASRGLSEPPYIMPNGRVVEGNERIVALRKIRDLLEEGGFSEEVSEDLEDLIENVPCKVFPSDLTKTEENVFLTRTHVTGKHEWPALNQARQIYRLHEESGFTVDEIKEMLGKSKPWVYQKLKAYEWTRDYLDKYGYDEIHDYSYFEELYKKRSNLRDVGFDINDPDQMDKFQEMVANKDIERAVQVRKLPKLLNNEETREEVLKGDVDEALERLPKVEPSEFSPRFSALEKALRQLQKLTREDLRMVRKHRPYRKLFQDVKEEVEDILEQTAGEN